MFPEESVQAATDAGVKNMMPVHWAGFALSQHTWTDPVERFVAAGMKSPSKLILPPIGKLFDAGTSVTASWWNQYK